MSDFYNYNVPRRVSFDAPAPIDEVDATLRGLVDASRAADAAPTVGMVAMEVPAEPASAKDWARMAVAKSMELRW